jgi:hypothetical protein
MHPTPLPYGHQGLLTQFHTHTKQSHTSCHRNLKTENDKTQKFNFQGTKSNKISRIQTALLSKNLTVLQRSSEEKRKKYLLPFTVNYSHLAQFFRAYYEKYYYGERLGFN